MTGPSRLTVVGNTVWSAALARTFATSGREVTFINTGLGSGIGMAIVRRTALDAIRIRPTRKIHPATRLIHRSVLTYECVDQGLTSARLEDGATQILIMDRLALINALLEDAHIESHRARQVVPVAQGDALTVQIGRDRDLETDLLVLTGNSDAAAAAQVASGLDPLELDLLTEVGWPDHGTESTSCMFATGDALFGGMASILTSPSGIYVSVRSGFRAVDRAGIETHEIIQALIDHPAFGDLIPSTQPGFTANHTLPSIPKTGTLQVQNRVLDLSSVCGALDPFELDLDLSLGQTVGSALIRLFDEGRTSSAALSGLRRSIKGLTTNHESVASTLSGAFATTSERTMDALFANLIQSRA